MLCATEKVNNNKTETIEKKQNKKRIGSAHGGGHGKGKNQNRGPVGQRMRKKRKDGNTDTPSNKKYGTG